MTLMLAPPIAWDDLTDAQRTLLLTTADVEVDPACELLDASLNLIGPLDLALTSGDDVQWAGLNTVHRSCSLTVALADDLGWGTQLLRLSQTLTDTVSGLSARRNLGVFCPHTPDRVVGETVDIGGAKMLQYAIAGQDRLYLLDRQVGASYVVPAGTGVLAAVAQAFTDAGLTGVLIDGTASAAVVPAGQPMTWPLLSSFAAGSNANTDDTGGAYTWLRVVNDLLALVNYRGVWCDENGFYRCIPYVEPSTAQPVFTFDADDETTSTVEPLRTRSQDQYQAPNRWIGIQSNMPSGATPALGAGLYVKDNVDDGPSSQTARGGLVWPVQLQYNAVDQDTLVALVEAQAAADLRAIATLTITTAPYPCAGHFDVFTYRDADLNGDALVQAMTWRIPLDGSPVEWTLEEV